MLLISFYNKNSYMQYKKKVRSVSVSSQLIYLWITFSYKYTLSPDSIIFLKSCSVIAGY